MLVLDSGGLSRLSKRSKRAAALIQALPAVELWPPLVQTVVVADSVAGRPRTDANVNRLLKSCDVDPLLTEAKARRAVALRAHPPRERRRRCRRGPRRAGRHRPDE